MKNLKKIIIYIALIFGGFLLGAVAYSGTKSSKDNTTQVDSSQQEVWTCSMHPQIRQDEPGNCPICGMELILADNASSQTKVDKTITQMSPDAVTLANIQTSKVEFASPQKEIFLQGIIKPDETKIASQSIHFEGRIEKLFISYEGQYVSRGQKIASIYSPDLVTAQQEFLEAIKYKTSNPLLYEAAKKKLEFWKLTDNQINTIENSGKVIENFNIQADASGYVTELNVSAGDYVSAGGVLFKIVDLSKVWVVFDAYEKDLSFIKIGDNVEYTISSFGDKIFTSKITFISPIIDPLKRTVDIRTALNNSSGKIKTGMFVQGKIKAVLNVTNDVMIIPKSAVLWTGKRSVVYVKIPDTQTVKYQLKVVELGEDLGDFYIIKNGLQEGEDIVTNGAFAIDAAAELAGNFNMMNLPSDIIDNQQISQLKGVSDDFIDQTNKMLNIYIDMTDFLIASSSTDVADEAAKLKDIANQLNLSSLSATDKTFWQKNIDIISKQSQNMIDMNNIDMQRKHYQQVSDAIIRLAKNFGHYNTTYYVQFCPMFNDNKGAYWLSNIEEIKNPYFGDLMLNCGETKQTLQ